MSKKESVHIRRSHYATQKKKQDDANLCKVMKENVNTKTNVSVTTRNIYFCFQYVVEWRNFYFPSKICRSGQNSKYLSLPISNMTLRVSIFFKLKSEEHPVLSKFPSGIWRQIFSHLRWHSVNEVVYKQKHVFSNLHHTNKPASEPQNSKEISRNFLGGKIFFLWGLRFKCCFQSIFLRCFWINPPFIPTPPFMTTSIYTARPRFSTYQPIYTDPSFTWKSFTFGLNPPFIPTHPSTNSKVIHRRVGINGGF